MTTELLPYGRQWIDDDDIAAVIEVLTSDYLTTGPSVETFERALAERVGAPHAVAVSNGTAALHACCAVLGLGPGDEVLVPAVTFVASANCVRYVGAEPVFVDVHPRSGLLDVEDARRRVTPRTRAILPVHLTGRPVDMGAVAALAKERRLVVIEDAAHALGARYQGVHVGAGRSSSLTTFSFHPVKHVTTGEGGAVTTRDPALAEALRVFRSHGIVRDGEDQRASSPGPWYYEQRTLGYNYRITDLQCALGNSQLAKLDRFLERRRALAARYDQLLRAIPWVTPIETGTAGSESAWHLYSVLIEFDAAGVDRAELMRRLRVRGVGSQVHYIPVPAQPYYRARGCDPASYPGAEAYYARTLSLPLFPAMELEDVDRVVEVLSEVLRG